MQSSHDIPQGWKLTYQEVSNNVYQVRLTSETGNTVEMTGDIFEGLANQCVESAREIWQITIEVYIIATYTTAITTVSYNLRSGLKNKLMKPVNISFLLLSGMILSCKNEDISISCTSKPTEVIVQQFVKAQGTIRQYSASSDFYIELNKCADCRTLRPNPPGLTAPAIPCNLPKSFRKDGLSVDFSGLLRVDTTLNYSVIDISGVPLQLTSIKRR